MRRPQFSLKSLLWLMACVACIFAGIGIEKKRAEVSLKADRQRMVKRSLELRDREMAIAIQEILSRGGTVNEGDMIRVHPNDANPTRVPSGFLRGYMRLP